MREILFRGFHECENGKTVITVNGVEKRGEWVEGYIYEHQPPLQCVVSDISEKSKWYILQTAFADWNMPRAMETIKVIPETVCQYTGLSDINNKKIFDGDIVKQKTTKEYKRYNSFEWEHYGIIKFGFCDFDIGKYGNATMGWYIEPLKNTAINPADYVIGNMNKGICQSYIDDACYPYEVICNIFENPELSKGE